jgi:hypothetical protein
MHRRIFSHPSEQTALKIILLIAGVAIILIVASRLPAIIGVRDFRPYWSSTFLLAHGQDFSDPVRMYSTEKTMTGWNEAYVMSAWFAPIGNVILLPFVLFPFPNAAYYWLLINIVVVFTSVFLIWHRTRKRLWIPLVAAFSFLMTLLSLFVGQVNTIEILGLASFLYFSELNRDKTAGASLVLTTIKPHLVIFTLPLLLLDILRRKQLRVIVGFAIALLVCALILFAFYPAWLFSFWKLVTTGMSTFRNTPTLSGLLVVAGEYKWGKWLWVVGLTLATAVWWKHGSAWNRRTLIDVTILTGIIASPIGWSYDQIMLLFPILRVLEWMVNGSLASKETIFLVLVLVLANAVIFYERILNLNEVWYFWVPLVALGVYLFAGRRRQVNPILPSG